MGFDLDPSRTLVLTLHCPFKGTEKVGKVIFYMTKGTEKVMILPEGHMLYVCRKAQPLGPVVWDLKAQVEVFWRAHGRMPTPDEVAVPGPDQVD